MSYQSEEKSCALVPIRAVPNAQPIQTGQRRGFLRTIGAILGIVHDYTADDIQRIKEALIQKKENEALKDRAEAEVKMAEAAKIHAEIEEIKSRTQQSQRHIVNFNEEDAKHRLHAAIGYIKQCGGIVAFDSEELERMTTQETNDSPQNASIDKDYDFSEDLEIGDPKSLYNSGENI